MNPVNIKREIRGMAMEAGFTDMAVARADALTEDRKRLREWLKQGRHGKMGYMENHFTKRTDPRELVEGAKSLVLFTYNYYPEKEQVHGTYKISRYAYGKDYHQVLKKKLYKIYNYLNEEYGVTGRVFTDSAPVLEKAWAVKAGLGWRGKNTLLIHPKRGSYFFIASLIIDIELPSDENNEMHDYCGRCTRCIDACPTDAIDIEGYKLNASQCISYATIEYKGEELPEEFEGKMEDWIFGCDICQEVCPWNKFSTPHDEENFEPHPDLLTYEKEDWENISEEEFREIFRKSAVKRTKYSGLTRNIAFISENGDD